MRLCSRPLHRAALPLLTVVVVSAVSAASALSGCSSDAAIDTDPVHNETLGSSTAPPADGDPGSGTASPGVTTGPVHVTTVLRVPESAATRALASYVQAHASSVIAGRVLPALRKVTAPDELARQRRLIADARARGITVPARPKLAIVSARATPGGSQLGVCLWLPSTEYVDAATGVSPAGPVPDIWAPAVASLSNGTMTWVVDKVGQPGSRFAPDCGELS